MTEQLDQAESRSDRLDRLRAELDALMEGCEGWRWMQFGGGYWFRNDGLAFNDPAHVVRELCVLSFRTISDLTPCVRATKKAGLGAVSDEDLFDSPEAALAWVLTARSDTTIVHRIAMARIEHEVERDRLFEESRRGRRRG